MGHGGKTLLVWSRDWHKFRSSKIERSKACFPKLKKRMNGGRHRVIKTSELTGDEHLASVPKSRIKERIHKIDNYLD